MQAHQPVGVLGFHTEKPGDIYEFLEPLGAGRYGTVWKCEDVRTGEVFACKKVDKSSFLEAPLLQQQLLRQEVAVLESLAGRHPNVIELKYVYEDEKYVYIVMEYCDAGDLFAHTLECKRVMSEGEAVALFRQLAQAVAFCHTNGVVHRDIKPENILLSNPYSTYGGYMPPTPTTQPTTLPHLPGQHQPLPSPSGDGNCLPTQLRTPPATRLMVKLGDFGLSMMLGRGEKTAGVAGSRAYEAPEMLLNRAYDHAVDVWSLGVTLYGMLCGRLPFPGSSDAKIARAILRGQVDLSSAPWPSISEAAKDLVREMLHPDAAQRITAEEVLKHEWLRPGAKLGAASGPAPSPKALAGGAAASAAAGAGAGAGKGGGGGFSFLGRSGSSRNHGAAPSLLKSPSARALLVASAAAGQDNHANNTRCARSSGKIHVPLSAEPSRHFSASASVTAGRTELAAAASTAAPDACVVDIDSLGQTVPRLHEVGEEASVDTGRSMEEATGESMKEPQLDRRGSMGGDESESLISPHILRPTNTGDGRGRRSSSSQRALLLPSPRPPGAAVPPLKSPAEEESDTSDSGCEGKGKRSAARRGSGKKGKGWWLW